MPPSTQIIRQAYQTAPPWIVSQGAERRIERRVAAAIPAAVRTDAFCIAAEILDISLSGMKLDVDIFLAAGTEITVLFGRTTALGRVRYCRPHVGGGFHAGVQLEEAFSR